jgi:hypothetical protein
MVSVHAVSTQQWDDIFQAAWDTYKGNKPRPAPSSSKLGSEDEAQESDSNDEELMDPLYNEMA